MKKFLFTIFAVLALFAFRVNALDLRTHTIGGKTYYVYTVRQGDTLDNLAARLNLTRAEIVRFNPSAADGLITGQWLIFPQEENQDKFSDLRNYSDSSEYTTYTVKRNETIFGVAHRLGVSPDDIVALNPEASSGVVEGMVLRVPSSATASNGNPELSTPASTSSPAKEAAPTGQIDVSKTNIPATETENEKTADPLPSSVSDMPDTPIEVSDTIFITVALPFMSETDRVTKIANNYNEFYRGFLIGTQQLAQGDTSPTRPTPVSINVIDTSITPLTSGLLNKSQVVIVGEDEFEIRNAASMADESCIILNVFNLRGEQYLSHPNVFHANIDQNQMYELAIKYILDNYSGFTPVVLYREGSRNEKESFINALRETYSTSNKDILEIKYSGKLSEDDLATIDQFKKYIFIPTSGSLAEFNSFAATIKKLREEGSAPDRIALFGYPDWIAFRGDATKQLANLKASYYSRFSDINDNNEAAKVLNSYTAWYGSDASEGIPNQAILGYDVASYLIGGIRAHGSAQALMQDPNPWQGVQSVFLPIKGDGTQTGYINNALFIVSPESHNTINKIIK